MSFPWSDYSEIVTKAGEIVRDRDKVGRNDATSFYEGFPHGSQDISFELKRRVSRILGAEKIGSYDVAEADALDLVNYAVFYVMVLRREMARVPKGEMKISSKPPAPTIHKKPEYILETGSTEDIQQVVMFQER